MISGADAVNSAVRSMRAAHRDMDALFARRRLRARIPREQQVPDEAPFPCCALCMHCGRLLDPENHDPMRGTNDLAARACPSCGRKSLADLRHTPTVHALGDVDSYDSLARASVGRKVLRTSVVALGVVGIVATIAVLFWAIIVAHTFDPFYLTLMAIGVGPFVLWSGVILRNHLRRSRAKTLPARWSMALPPRSSRRRYVNETSGTVEPVAELLEAPLSGRSCLAYEVAARRDDEPDAPLGTWLLVEQRNAPFKVGGQQVSADGMLFQVERKPIAVDAMSIGPDGLAQYVRQRGFLPTDDLVLFETVVLPGQGCTLRTTGIAGDAPVVDT